MQKVILITGGNRGIGKATALLAAQRGYQVIITYHTNQVAAHELCDELSASGYQATAISCDVSKEENIIALFSGIKSKFGRLDVLVNNAGIVAPISSLKDISLSRLEKLFSTNVFGSFLCAREAVKLMSDGDGGSIVNLSSAAARLGSPKEFIDYAATKGAIDTMTIGLAKEVAEDGIRVNAVRPGLIETDMHADTGFPERVDKLVTNVPLKRVGKAEEVAETILWLASDKASYITGAILDVSGGR